MESNMLNRDLVQTENNKNGPFLNVGFGFIVNMNRVTSILPYAGKSVKLLYSNKLNSGELFDATRGRKKRSIIVFDTGAIMSSSFSPETIANRQL